MKKALFIIIIFLNALGLSAQAQELFRQALDLRQNGKTNEAKELFLKASQQWENLSHQNNSNVNLWFNAGNSSFLAEDIGRSVLFWKKAMDIDPFDQSIRKNWELSQQKIPQDLRTFGSISPFHSAIVSNLFVISALLLFSVIAVIMGIKIILKRKILSQSVLVFIMFLCVTLLGILMQGVTKPQEGVILNSTKALKGDSLAYEPVRGDELLPGTLVQILEDRQGFQRIKLASGQEGWVVSSSLEKTIP